MAPTDPVTDIVKRIASPGPGETDEKLQAFLTGHTAKELRSACKIFSVKVRSRNGTMDNKTGYETMLVHLARSRRESEEAAADQRNKLLQGTEVQLTLALASTRKTRHCSFRLLNVLFSAKFCERLNEMGAQPVRRELDAGAVGGLNPFWKEVEAEFVKERAEYAGLVSRDARFSGIDPGHIVPHDSTKLNQMWKDTSSKYAAAHARATKSGTHETDFFDFCMGQLDALYVSTWLLVKPQAFSAAVGSLPKNCQLDTLEERSLSEEGRCSTPSSSKRSGNSKKRVSEVDTMIAFLESRFGSSESKTQQKEEMQQGNKRARTFKELEHLTKSLCAAIQGGVSSTIVGRLEQQVEKYTKKVEAMDALE